STPAASPAVPPAAPAAPAPATDVTAAACSTPTTTASQSAAYDQLRRRFTGDMAQALSTQSRLTATLDKEHRQAQALSSQIRQQKTRITALEKQVRDLDRQIGITQGRITVEKAQVGAMARAIYRQPISLPLLLARSGSIRDALQLTAELMIAGERAHAVQARLESDLARQSADRQARESERRRADGMRRDLEVSLKSNDEGIRRQVLLIGELQGVISRLRQAMAGERNQPPAVMSVLAQLLEHLQKSVVLRSFQLAAQQIRVGAGVATGEATLTAGRLADAPAHALGTAAPTLHIALPLLWPMADARVTQSFGPTDFWLAPPLGNFEHYHTGVDLAAPEATPVGAAADGVVASVTRSSVGYGTYVILEHEPGVLTLYGHLLDAAVSAGDRVTRGQPIGFEGSTGFSTGAHLHFELRVNEQFVDPMPYLIAPKSKPGPDEGLLAPAPIEPAPAAAGD
ncbi:MAG: peptidoglycan DD-metalloendopeptidase family protein, partial [Candidatus Dormibacteraeota bacterium]|nr:peptidoglycan DD-metalloendopeptidase family protein [Candidatus Dormibacteraeota bacterium]